MPLDSLSLVRVTRLDQNHRVAENVVRDRAQQVIRRFDSGPLRSWLSVMLVRGEVDLGMLALRHRACGVCGGVCALAI